MTGRAPVSALMLISLLVCGLAAGDPAGRETLELAALGVMYVGGQSTPLESTSGRGRRQTATSQTQTTGQALVHYLVPTEEKRAGRLPVIMVPGLGLTSTLYLSTPDGREGWAQIFARAGHPVYLFNQPNSPISGFGAGASDATASADTEPEASSGFMRWSNETVWRRWGIGPEVGVPFDDGRYPVEQIEQLYAAIAPVFGAGRGGTGVQAAALVELLEKIGPATLVLHSAGGDTGLEAARLRRGLVRAIVAVEITGSPTEAADVQEHFADTTFIGLFGDHFEVRMMQGRYDACKTTARLISENGGTAEVIRLPELGIRGNCHLMMQDNNSREIAELILQRLKH